MAQAGLNGKARRVGPKVGLDGVTTPKLFGLIELDTAGTVLYTRIETDGRVGVPTAPDVTGRNFYTEVAPFKNVGEFRQQLDTFSRGSQPAHSMDFTCQYEDGPLPVRVLLARIRERTELDVTKSILVHIRKVK
jgi:hypothetical protein